MGEKGGLLEELWRNSRLDCMSDLHTGRYRALACSLLDAISGDDYPVEEWNDAVAYLLELPGPTAFSSAAEARAYCREQLRRGGRTKDQ